MTVSDTIETGIKGYTDKYSHDLNNYTKSLMKAAKALEEATNELKSFSGNRGKLDALFIKVKSKIAEIDVKSREFLKALDTKSPSGSTEARNILKRVISTNVISLKKDGELAITNKLPKP